MRAAPAVLLAWGALLAGLTAGLLFFTTDALALSLLGGAAAAIVGFAVLYARPARADDVRRLPDLSYATIIASVGAATLVIGVGFGLWLILIGAGLLALGVGGLARELRAERRRP